MQLPEGILGGSLEPAAFQARIDRPAAQAHLAPRPGEPGFGNSLP